MRRVAVVHALADVAEHRQQHDEGWLRRRRIARFELGSVAAFHLGVAFTLLAAPREQVITPGTSVIFGTIPLPVWAAWFTLTGVVAAACTIRNTDMRLALTWIGTFPLGIGWCSGFGIAVSHGKGNAVLLLGWVFLLVWWAVLAVRLYVGGSGTKWDGSD